METSIATKTCARCKEAKVTNQFWYANKAKGTLQSRCKPCHLAAQNESRLRHLDEFRDRKNAERRSLRDRETERIVARRREYRLAAIARDPEGERAKSRARDKRYYIEHRAAAISKAAAWAAAHHDRVREFSRMSYYKRRDSTDEHVVALREAERERRRLNSGPTQAAYRAAHREEIRARACAWAKAHPDRKMAWVRKRRALLAQAEGQFTQAEWSAIKAAQHFACTMCGRREPEIKLTVDHIVPIIDGGTNWPDNIQALCGSCNSTKGRRHSHQRATPIDPT